MMIRRNICLCKTKTAVKIINGELPAVTTSKNFVLLFTSEGVQGLMSAVRCRVDEMCEYIKHLVTDSVEYQIKI